MKWVEPEHGDVQTNSGFLWTPKKIDRETRWLEFAVWDEVWGPCKGGDAWVPSRWLS